MVLIDPRKEGQLGWQQDWQESTGLDERHHVQEIEQKTTTDGITATVRGTQGRLWHQTALHSYGDWHEGSATTKSGIAATVAYLKHQLRPLLIAVTFFVRHFF